MLSLMIVAGFEGTDHCEKKNQVLTAKAGNAFYIQCRYACHAWVTKKYFINKYLKQIF